jgi:hypothetical protein
LTAFITLLREAHAVHTAHSMGETHVATIAKRTRLPIPVIAEWVRLLNLPTRFGTIPYAGTRVGFIDFDNQTNINSQGD